MLAFSLLKATGFFKENLNKILMVIAAIIAVLVLLNISAISERFGIETRATLKAKAVAEKAVSEKAIQANATLLTEIVKEKQSSKAVEEILINKQSKDLKLSKELETIKIEKNKVIDKIKASKVNKPEVSSHKPAIEATANIKHTYSQEESREISETNIKAIWAAYDKVEGEDHG